METHDIIIVGGGIIGFLTALAIVDSTNLNVLLLDEKGPPLDFTSHTYSNRVSAITLGSQQYLSGLGAWPFIVTQRVSPFNQIEIHDSNASSSVQFYAEEIAKESL